METDTESSPLSPAILRGLGDRSYDKRKASALEVTSVVKNLVENSDKTRIMIVINLLSSDFVHSKNVHHRKGGLIGLASSAIGLINNIEEYLYALIVPVLDCFDDAEARVCYYACEALYNISKVSRIYILNYFNIIFDGLCKLFAHVDSDVRNGASLLDRLIKDIVTETEQFDIESFMPLLQKHIKRTKPYIRQLLVSWISVLNTVPDIHMLDYLPEFLDGLFNMIADSNKEIKTMVEHVLKEFLLEISQQRTLLDSSRTYDSNTDETNRISSSISSSSTSIINDDISPQTMTAATSTVIILDYSRILTILILQSYAKDRDTRLTALQWIHQFILLGGTKLVTMYAELLLSIMFCISDVDVEIQNQTKICNNELMSLCQSTVEYFELKPIISTLLKELTSEHIISRLTSLQWLYMLHNKDSVAFNKLMSDILPVLLKILSDMSDEVILLNLQVISNIAMNDSEQFHYIFHSLVRVFYLDRFLLETRGALIIRKLCTLLPSRMVYMSLASILQSNATDNSDNNNIDHVIAGTENNAINISGNSSTSSNINSHAFIYDYDFLSLLVQTLNLILLTAPELQSLRNLLKNSCFHSATPCASSIASYMNTVSNNSNNMRLPSQQQLQPPDKELFVNLFICWSHNPVALFSLCLLSQAYDIAALLIHKFAELEVTVGFLIQLDKLIQLIESPVFLQLRLQLLDANSYQHMHLLQSLYGLLMILPQSQSYRILSERLSTASTLHMHIGFTMSYQQQQQHLLSNMNLNNTTNKTTSNTNNNIAPHSPVQTSPATIPLATSVPIDSNNNTSTSNSNSATSVMSKLGNKIKNKAKNNNNNIDMSTTDTIVPTSINSTSVTAITTNTPMETTPITARVNTSAIDTNNTLATLNNDELVQKFLQTQAQHSLFRQSVFEVQDNQSTT